MNGIECCEEQADQNTLRTGDLQDLWLGPKTKKSPDGFRLSPETVKHLKNGDRIQDGACSFLRDMCRLETELDETGGCVQLAVDLGQFTDLVRCMH
jgi:hypothetical protein